MKTNKTNRTYGSRRGFTLLETVVAISVLLAGLVGVLILAGQSARSIRVANSKIVAAHLAQEGIEVVINIRHTNWLAAQSWRTDIPSTTRGIVSYNSTALTETLNPDNYCLSRVAGVYQHQPPPSFRFSILSLACCLVMPSNLLVMPVEFF